MRRSSGGGGGALHLVWKETPRRKKTSRATEIQTH
jgi:hypothetical protein